MLEVINSLTPVETTACFSGHRETKLPWGEQLTRLEDNVYRHIADAYEQGTRTFIHGFCHGFDILAAKQVIRYKNDTGSDVLLLGIMPFMGLSKGSDAQAKRDYEFVQSNTQVIDILSDKYRKSLYFIRNDLMIRRSSLLICYYDGQGKSGTGYTVAKAEKAGLRIVNTFSEI